MMFVILEKGWKIFMNIKSSFKKKKAAGIQVQFLAVAILFLVYGCQHKKKEIGTDNSQVNLRISYNNKSDKKYTTFHRYDSVYIEGQPFISPPNYKIEEDTSNTTFTFDINKPENILLGFNQLIIFPGTNINVAYQLFENNKERFHDTIYVRSGPAYILNRNGRLDFTNHQNINFFTSNHSIENIKNKIRNIELDSLVKRSFDSIDLSPFNNQQRDYLKPYLDSYYKQDVFYAILKRIENLHLDSDKIRSLYNELHCVSQDVFNSTEIKDFKYWITVKAYYNTILDPIYSQNDFLKETIDESVKEYDDKTKQYIFLQTAATMAAKNLEPHQFLISTINWPPFQKKINDLLDQTPILKKERDIKLITVNGDSIPLNKLFTSTSQNIIYLDFSGSWCKPCLKEIEAYSKSKLFESNEKIRTIWIFFENNDKEWLKVIKKYNLNRKDCFLAINENGTNLKKIFSEEFGWINTFPHSFIFKSNGQPLDLNAPPISELNIQRYNLQDKTSKLNQDNLPPPPPNSN